jgi:hypothetical protein
MVNVVVETLQQLTPANLRKSTWDGIWYIEDGAASGALRNGNPLLFGLPVVLVDALRIVGYDILGKGKDAELAVKLKSIGGVSSELHLPGLGPQPYESGRLDEAGSTAVFCRQGRPIS